MLVLVPYADGVVRVCLLVGAALLIQLRLLANLMDGMVAVENERAQPTGALFNELPDRLSDSLLIVAAGTRRPGNGRRIWRGRPRWCGSRSERLSDFAPSSTRPVSACSSPTTRATSTRC